MALFRFKQRTVADPLAQQNFEQLEGLSILTKKQSSGTFSVTFTASAASGVITVTHNLGAVPVAVAPAATNAGGLITYNVSNFTATTFDIQGFLAGAATATVAGCWIAAA